MLSIRLSRIGKKKQPHYRIVVLPHTKDPWGDYIELLGSYNPRSKEVTLKKERIEYWISVGAQPSDTVHNILVSEGVIKADKRKASNLGKKFKAKMKDEEEKKAKEAAALRQAQDDNKEAEKEEAKAPKEEAAEETPAQEPKAEETPATEEKVEEKKEEEKAE